jgi:hypothetical protein
MFASAVAFSKKTMVVGSKKIKVTALKQILKNSKHV